MSMTTPIVDFVRSYAKSGTSRLHMPGHKGQKLLGFEDADITEIKGADELYEAEGIIAESEANATKLFGTAHTYYSTEGSSQCIRAMLCLALQAAPAGQRPVLLAARNAHKALLYAAALLDFDIEWLWPAPEAAGALCSCPVTAGQLEQALERLSGQGRTPFGVYVTSPDYLGGMQDIAALSKVCDAHGAPLLVDNAHGAYLNFLVGGSKHPMALGAAMCCDSGHKTLPVLTGGAYLHLGLKAPVQDETAVRNALALFGSTSPSYLILQSLDRCNRYLSEGYPLRLYSCCGQLTRLRRVLNEAAALGLTGTAVAEALRKYAIECEYADPRYVVLMFTPENPAQDYDRLEEAVAAVCAALPGVPECPEPEGDTFTALAAEAEPVCSVRAAVFAPQQTIPAAEALGRVCAMPTVSCPPAIPIVVSGERVSPAAIELFARYHVETVAVIRE